MDSVPFTLFFMVSIFGFQGNMVQLYVGGSPIEEWPRNCSTRNYCHVKPTDYPSENTLSQMFDDLDYAPPIPHSNETEHREGQNICRTKDDFAEEVYMVKDKHGKIRYALHIPGVYSIHVALEPCDEHQMLDEWRGRIKCEQRYTYYPFLVLNSKHTKLESAEIKLPTSCAPIYNENK